jgi:hypothetical protein
MSNPKWLLPSSKQWMHRRRVRKNLLFGVKGHYHQVKIFLYPQNEKNGLYFRKDIYFGDIRRIGRGKENSKGN